MSRIRTIKPEFSQSESMGRMTRDARLLFVLMWTLADDEGRLRGNSKFLCGQLFPYDEDVGKNIDSWIDELIAEDCIIRYKVGGSQFIQIREWKRHQKIDRPTESRFPDPPGEKDCPREPSAHPREDSSRTRRGLVAGPGPGPKDHGPRKGTKDQDQDQEEASASRADGSKASPSQTEAVRRVFEHYRGRHPTAKLTSDRRKLILNRLKDGYSEDDLCRAIDGLHLSPFHRGENDDGTQYLGIEHALRNGAKVEAMLEIAARPPSRLTKTTAQNARAVDEWIEEASP